jgi:RNA polymerase sigma factor (sigma-70 family)
MVGDEKTKFGRTTTMISARSHTRLAGQLGTLYSLGTFGALPDDQLLERFLARKDPAEAEAAFAALVDRHGGMVLSVCERVLRDSHEAHDAFQATFLILVRKAGSIRRRESVGGWLFGIARRVAVRARIQGERRRRHLANLCADRRFLDAGGDLTAAEEVEPDYGPLIAEIDRLPESIRTPVVLHYFEGLSTEATAERMGCRRGTVLSRLYRARKRLRRRLESRGVSLEALMPASAASLRWATNVTVPSALLNSTVRAATCLTLAGTAIDSVVPATVALLSHAVMRSLMFTKVRLASVLAVLAVASAAIGLAVVSLADD